MAERALHIAVDGRELVGRPTGVGRYLAEVLRCWAADPSFVHLCTIVVPRDPPAGLFPQDARFAWRIEPDATAGTWWEQTRLARRLREMRPDVLFAAGYTAPLRLGIPFVLAVYDVSFFAHPEWFRIREGLRRRWLTRAAARRAHSVVTISEFSAGEIVRWLEIPRERVRIAAPGAPDPGPPPAAARREPIVLYVGSLFNRRHIPELLRAFAIAHRSTAARLVLVGDNRTAPRIDPLAIARELGIASAVEWRAYVSDADLERLYWTSSVFAFLSEYEGFAMTPLEALAHGVPPVLLETPVAREVYGDAARYVPADPERIARALTALLTDGEERSRLVTAGRRAIAAYSWPRTARTILTALEQAASR